MDGSIEERMRLVTFSDGVRLRTNEGLGLMTATKNPGMAETLVRNVLDTERSCVTHSGGRIPKDTAISQENLLGYETYRIVTDMKLARLTVWRAPALGCAELRHWFEKLDQPSGRVGSSESGTEWQLTSVRASLMSSSFKYPEGLEMCVRASSPQPEQQIVARNNSLSLILRPLRLRTSSLKDSASTHNRYMWGLNRSVVRSAEVGPTLECVSPAHLRREHDLGVSVLRSL